MPDFNFGFNNYRTRNLVENGPEDDSCADSCAEAAPKALDQ